MADVDMSLGWVIVYVDDLAVVAEFYESTFGLRIELSVPNGTYAQMDTGATKLTFAAYTLGEHNFEGGVHRAPA